MSNKTIDFQKGKVSGKVSLLGAMVGPVEFLLSNDKDAIKFSKLLSEINTVPD